MEMNAEFATSKSLFQHIITDWRIQTSFCIVCLKDGLVVELSLYEEGDRQCDS